MIIYTWDRRKAARNLREHRVSFTLAEYALRTGYAVPVEEQFRGGEWRTKLVVMIDAVLLLSITVGTGDEDEDSDQFEQGNEDADGIRVLRIITAREASKEEVALFFESSPQHGER